MTTQNLWLDFNNQLVDAYARGVGSIRFELVTHAITQHITGRARILDIGGGYGEQAIYLARSGHDVTVLDVDRAMLAIAEDKLSCESEDVRGRVTLLHGDGHYAGTLVGDEFDLVCCHSVLMYLRDPYPMLEQVVARCRPGGMVSVLATNRDAIAMRSALQRRWAEASATLRSGRDQDKTSLPTFDHSRSEISDALRGIGVAIQAWYGVGIFTDHIADVRADEDLGEMCATEWFAGLTDPYRHVARCYHLIGERTPGRAAANRTYDGMNAW